jgi:hypothetical protein
MLFFLFTVSFALPEEQCNGADGVCLLQLKDKDKQIAKHGEFLDTSRFNLTRRMNLSASRSTAEFQEAVLMAHNVYRCMHGVQHLVWDEKIAEKAQELADKGAFKHSTAAERMYVDSSGKESKAEKYKGENLWMCTKDHTFQEALTFAVNSWYGEIEFTDGGLVGADGQGNEGIVAHYTQVVWAKTTRVGCAVGKMGRDWDRGEGTLVVCQYGQGGNFENGYPQYVNGPVRNFGDCGDKAALLKTVKKNKLLPKKARKCRRKARKACGKTEWDCLAEENAKCKIKGVTIHDPEISHDPNSADYCPCCMDYYQMKSGNLDLEDEEELASVDEEDIKKFEAAEDCCGGFDGHQKLGFQTPGMGSTRFFKR